MRRTRSNTFAWMIGIGVLPAGMVAAATPSFAQAPPQKAVSVLTNPDSSAAGATARTFVANRRSALVGTRVKATIRLTPQPKAKPEGVAGPVQPLGDINIKVPHGPCDSVAKFRDRGPGVCPLQGHQCLEVTVSFG
jgi:hypothetical protein